MEMSWMRQRSVRGINLLIFNEWFEKVKCLKMKSSVRSLLMMKNARYILFMRFDYITARKMQVQTRMKRQTLQWRICLMRHALGSLNEQLSSLVVVFSASGWVKPGGVSAGRGVRSLGQWQLQALCWDMAFPSPVCDVRYLHFTPAPRPGPHPVRAPSPGSLIQQVETLMWASTSRHLLLRFGLV